MKPKTAGHGGKRPGAGRKPISETGTQSVTVRLTGSQVFAFKLLGGADWLRAQLDKAIANKR